MRTANRSADAEVAPFIQAFSSFRETGDDCGTEIALYKCMKRNIAENDPTIGWRVKCVSRALMMFSALMPWGASAERLDGSPLEYALRGQWTAMGTVGHWGHVHTRQNLYDAIVTIEAIDGAWKITDLEVIEVNRIDPSAATIATREQTQVVGSGGT